MLDKFVLLMCLISFLSRFNYATSECPAQFEGLCKCGFVRMGENKRLTYVTNCTNTGFDNTMMLRVLPPETEVLVFVGNEVKDLPLNIFGLETVYSRLHTIDLSNNHIQTIKGRTFHNVANVTKLILNDNDLYIVSKDHHPRMFSNFVNLKELHLRNAFTEKVKAGDYLGNLAEIFENSTLRHLQVLNLENNEISAIHHGEFCSLPSLEELYLADNHLKDVNLNFSCLMYLKKLDVASNLICHLSDSSIKNLESVTYLALNLTSNPFRCDCEFIKTYEWMTSTIINLLHSDTFFCFEGFTRNVGKKVFEVPLDDFQCVPPMSKLEYHSSASVIALIVGFIFLTIVLSVVLYKRKVIVVSYLRELFQPIRNKFRYVSLERRDSSMVV